MRKNFVFFFTRPALRSKNAVSVMQTGFQEALIECFALPEAGKTHEYASAQEKAEKIRTSFILYEQGEYANGVNA